MQCAKCGKTIQSSKCFSCGFNYQNEFLLIWNMNCNSINDIAHVLNSEKLAEEIRIKKVEANINTEKTTNTVQETIENTEVVAPTHTTVKSTDQNEVVLKTSEPLAFKEIIILVLIGLVCLWGLYSYFFNSAARPKYDSDSKLYGFDGRLGFTTVSPVYEDIARKDDFFDKVFWVKKEGRWGAINRKNQVVVPFEYETEAYYLDINELNELTKNGKHGLISKKGEVMIPFEYDKEFMFDENGTTLAIKDGKVGAINTDNEIVIPFDYNLNKYSYNAVYSYKEKGMVLLEKDSKIGVIDSNGNIVLPFIYDVASEIAYDGEPLVLTQVAHFYNKGIIILKKDSKAGVVNKNNETIIPFEYDAIYFINGSFSAHKNNKSYSFDVNGNLLEE